MYFNFRLFFRGISRKYPYSQTPAISRGCIEGKPSTRDLGICLSQSLIFGNLATAFGVCFLKFRKISLGNDSGRCKDVLQDHGVWLSRSIAFGNSVVTYKDYNCP